MRRLLLVAAFVAANLYLLGGLPAGSLPADPAAVLIGLPLTAGLLALYALPTIVAASHPHRRAIGALNLLLGWTLLGWIAALVWALTRTKA